MAKKTRKNKPILVPGHRLRSIESTFAGAFSPLAYRYVCECGDTGEIAMAHVARTNHTNHALSHKNNKE